MEVRVRFAPSPTGGLHLGGVRTVLYNYLFAKQHNGKFILRIEDTDQTRFVEGAENYIYDCLSWCGLEPDESPIHGGDFGPYRQSERKASYREYAEKLVKNGHAYYAFDTQDELEKMRDKFRSVDNPAPQYDHAVRMQMKNSLTLPASEVTSLINNNTPHVTRIKMPDDEKISFDDLIRGEVSFDSTLVDDKVLLKADGMPTYHLAVVVDDFLMKITHAFRGEEWLPSAPVHILLWKYLFGEDKMPKWAHLPLIMGPEGKLSKRDGAKYGFPVFAMNWTDPASGDVIEGFREKGFLPAGFINMLAMLGWNDGSEQELFDKNELVEKFSIDRVHKGGARFDYEKAKWYNHEWIKRTDAHLLREELFNQYYKHMLAEGETIEASQQQLDYCEKVVSLVKDRCMLLYDLWSQSSFFFISPKKWDDAAVKPKWNVDKEKFFKALTGELQAIEQWESAFIEDAFKKQAVICNIKPGELQLPFRIMLVGGKFGPPVFDIAAVIGKSETINRINAAVNHFS